MDDITSFEIIIPGKEGWSEWIISGGIDTDVFEKEIDVDKVKALKSFAETLGFKVRFYRERYIPGRYEKVEEL